jgi:hypothetical protein
MVEAKMTVRPPVRGPDNHWRKTAHREIEDVAFVAECLRLWDQGRDTKDISLILLRPEYVVETATRLGRESRKNGGVHAENAAKEKDPDQWS